MKIPGNLPRCRQLIERSIHTLGLDLRGLTVLTEAASGYYALTPFIAVLAGADRVLALTRDSRYATADEVCRFTEALQGQWGFAVPVEILRSRDDPRISEADVVTNCGFVRPLDAAFLQRLKSTAAIPLMWETWEFRPEDLDLPACRRLGIPVLGTNEHCPELEIFTYIGHVALKLLYEMGFEAFRSRVLVLGSGEFVGQVQSLLERAGAEVGRLSPGSWQLSDPQARRLWQSAEALVVVEYHTRRMLIGAGGEITPQQLSALNPHLAIAHICGGADRAGLDALGFPCHPAVFAPAGYMSVATDYVGPRPLIDLHAAGLTVGAHLARARLRGLSAAAAEAAVLAETPFAQAFPTTVPDPGARA